MYEPGWYEVCHDTTLRETVELTSPQIETLYSGTNVHVVEIIGRRARIVKPHKGWASLKSSANIQILKCLTTDAKIFKPKVTKKK